MGLSSGEHPGIFAVESETSRVFRAEVREWLEDNLPEHLCHRAYWVTPDVLRPWHRALFERGWIAPHWPKEYGGMGASLSHQIIVYEEMSRLGAPTMHPHGLYYLGPTLIEVGTEAQKKQHLPNILSGDITWCQGYSEPNAGSDLASVQTRARLDGDEFVINGQKTWTTNGHYANWMFALVRTDANAEPRHAGISFLLIDMSSPGITRRPIPNIKGDIEFAEEFFDDVRVPRENLVGDLNDGWRIANLVMGNERFFAGHPRNPIKFLNRAKQVARVTGAIDEPDFRDLLAGLEIDIAAFSAYYRHAAALQDIHQRPASVAPIIRIMGGELVQRGADLINEAAGGHAAGMNELMAPEGAHDVAAYYFEARRNTIGAGSSEIQRHILSRRVLDLPR